jgi:hypothetical protein
MTFFHTSIMFFFSGLERTFSTCMHISLTLRLSCLARVDFPPPHSLLEDGFLCPSQLSCGTVKRAENESSNVRGKDNNKLCNTFVQ